MLILSPFISSPLYCGEDKLLLLSTVHASRYLGYWGSVIRLLDIFVEVSKMLLATLTSSRGDIQHANVLALSYPSSVTFVCASTSFGLLTL